MKTQSLALATIAAIGTVGAADAATLMFDQSGPNALSKDYMLGDVTLTVTADAGVGTAYVTEKANGLGVFTDRPCVPTFFGCKDILDDTDTDIDSQPGYEKLTFSFSAAVYLQDVLFGDFDGDDDYWISFNGGAFEKYQTSNPYVYAGSEKVSFFSVKAVNDGILEWDDSFTVAGLNAVVPLPAAGWMLIAGVGGLAAMRRRKG